MSELLRKQHGLALIEALVASAVLGIGLVGATQLTLKTLYKANENRQNTVAQHLAQEAMDCLQATPQAGQCPAQEDVVVQGVRYTRYTHSTLRGPGQAHDLQVRVTWSASGGLNATVPTSGASAQNHIEWHSSISALPNWVGVSSP